MHHAPSALLRRVWDSPGVAGEPHALWTTISEPYPLKPPFAGVPATSLHQKSKTGFALGELREVAA